jgi:hypothetical protein
LARHFATIAATRAADRSDGGVSSGGGSVATRFSSDVVSRSSNGARAREQVEQRRAHE